MLTILNTERNSMNKRKVHNLAQFVSWQFVDVETELPLLVIGHGGRLHLIVAVDGPRLPQ